MEPLYLIRFAVDPKNKHVHKPVTLLPPKEPIPFVPTKNQTHYYPLWLVYKKRYSDRSLTIDHSAGNEPIIDRRLQSKKKVPKKSNKKPGKKPAKKGGQKDKKDEKSNKK